MQKLLSEFMNNAETKELLMNTKMLASRGIILIDKFFILKDDMMKSESGHCIKKIELNINFFRFV